MTANVSRFSPAVLVVAGFLMAATLQLSAVGAQNTTFESSACNVNKIAIGSPFFNDLANLLADLEANTAVSGFNYKSQQSGRNLTAYGEGICNENLSESQCTDCLVTLGNEICSICSAAVGARVQLVDCYIRYEEYNF